MCKACGAALEPPLGNPVPLTKLINPQRGLPWRYPTLLPVSYAPELDDYAVPYTVRSPMLESRLGVAEAWLVDCTGFGSGTFKDLEAAVVIAGAREMGMHRVSVHSTGNTALAYRYFARRAGLPCASYVPLQNAKKIGDVSPDADYPIYLVDTSFPNVSKVAKHAALRNGWHHLAPVGWKLEGKASLASWLSETTPHVNLIVQTIAGGYGPLGYETGFRRLRKAVDSPSAILENRRYLLFQPTDANTLTQAWGAETSSLNHEELRLPADPFEPTLQSTNPVATLPLLRAAMPPGTALRSVAPEVIDGAKSWADEVFAEAGITLDYNRERSAYISVAGLLATKLSPTTRLAFIVTGSRTFQRRASAEMWQILAPQP